MEPVCPPPDQLVLACYEGDIDTVKRLLDDPELVDARGEMVFWDGDCTPLMAAALTGQVEVGELLLDRGAALTWQDGDTVTPLHLSLSGDRTAFADTLCQRGATVDVFAAAALPDAGRLRNILQADPAAAQRTGDLDVTPLHYARTAEAAQLLTDAGCPLDARDGYHQGTPLKWALARGDERRAVVEALLARGAAVDVFDAVALHRRDTVEAALAANPQVVHEKAPPHSSLASGGTLLHVASAAGNRDLAELLLNEGANVNARDQGLLAATPLHWAAGNDHPSVVRLLLEHGAWSNVTDRRFDGTPRGWAEHSGAGRAIATLDELDAD